MCSGYDPVKVIIGLVILLLLFPARVAEGGGEFDFSEQLPSYYEQLDTLRRGEHGPVENQEVKTYTVKPGDTLYKLAKRYGTEISTLRELNRLENPHFLPAGKEIKIVSLPGVIHRVEEGEEWKCLASRYGVELSRLKRLSSRKNRKPVEGEKLLVHGERPSELSRSSFCDHIPSFKWPLEGPLTSPFGFRAGGFHYGIDIAAEKGTPVKAAAEGTVTAAEHRGSYGMFLKIDHGGGWETRYAHHSRLKINEGERVEPGQIVALVGSTGNATGPHLHFEILEEGRYNDPLEHLP